jgi:hypothetical protein
MGALMSFFQLEITEDENRQLFVREKAGNYDPVPVPYPNYAGMETDLVNLRGRGSEGPVRYPNQEKIATRIGEQLFRTFFPDPICDNFRAYGKTQTQPRIVLHLPRSLFHLPWEVLKDPRDRDGKFLSLLGSIVRCDTKDKDSIGLAKSLRKPRLKLLAISANPKDRPILGDLSWRSSKQVKFQKLSPATFEKFEEEVLEPLSDYDGFVFWGHGDIDDQRHGVLVFLQRTAGLRSLWTYISNPKKGHQIGLVITDQSPLRLGYVFACESGAWIDKGLEFTNSIVANLLERTPLAFIVGAQTKLDVYAAEVCLDASMRALRTNPSLPLDLAITAGRRGILNIQARDVTVFSPLDWWVPVTYVKRNCLPELEQVDLADPFLVEVPLSDSTATASPLGGLPATENVGTIEALSNIASASIKQLFS